MLDIFKIPSISENVFKLLDKEDWLNCRLVCQSWKSTLDKPYFWLEKLKSIGHPQEIHDQWLDLIQMSIQDGKPKQILALCLMMKFYSISGLEYTVSLVWRRQCLNFPPILYAAKYGQLEVVKLIHKLDKNFDRPITLFPHSNGFYLPLFLAIKYNHQDVVKYILENVQDAIEKSIGDGNSNALQYAVSCRNFEIVKILAPRTQNLNHQNDGGNTALHRAIRDVRIFKYLLTFGAKIDANISNNGLKLPLHYVCQNKNMNLENRIEMVRLLIPVTINIDQVDACGKSPLNYAQEDGHSEIVEILLANSKSNFLNRVYNHPNRPDSNGRLPLHDLCIGNSFNFELDFNEQIELVKSLLTLTSDITYQDSEGNTALHYAAYCGFTELVKLLVKQCDVNIRNQSKYKIDIILEFS